MTRYYEVKLSKQNDLQSGVNEKGDLYQVISRKSYGDRKGVFFQNMRTGGYYAESKETFDNFFELVSDRAYEVKEHEVNSIIKQLEAANKEYVIEKALIERDKELFSKLADL